MQWLTTFILVFPVATRLPQVAPLLANRSVLSTHTLSSASLCEKASPLPHFLRTNVPLYNMFFLGSTDAHFALFCGKQHCRSSDLIRFVQCIFLVINQVILCTVYKEAQFFACLVVVFIWMLL
jgi:hypothetical protein